MARCSRASCCGAPKAAACCATWGRALRAGPTSVSLTGVSVNTNGAPSGGGGSGVSAGGGIITQLGPNLLSFDPTISAFANFQHATSPQSLTSLTGTNALIDNVRSYQHFITRRTGPPALGATLTYASTYNKLNSNSFSLNPYTSGDLDLSVTQNLLNGFGTAVNGRNIRVQKNNMKVTDLQFKQQVITTVTAALNLYWDLVSFNQDVKARQEEVATAQQLLKNNQEQVRIGTLAEIEVTRAQSQLYAARQDLVISADQSSAAGNRAEERAEPAGYRHVRPGRRPFVPLDTITIPAKDELPLGQRSGRRCPEEPSRDRAGAASTSTATS